MSANAPLQLIGIMCYSLYIWHLELKGYMLRGTYDWQSVAAYGAALVSLSLLSYRFIEFYWIRDWRPLFPLNKKTGIEHMPGA